MFDFLSPVFYIRSVVPGAKLAPSPLTLVPYIVVIQGPDL